MSTTHRIVYDDSSELSGIEAESVDLVVTSPPYPMVAMWDEIFGELDENISIIVCKGKKQKDHKFNFIVKNYWR